MSAMLINGSMIVFPGFYLKEVVEMLDQGTRFHALII